MEGRENKRREVQGKCDEISVANYLDKRDADLNEGENKG